MKRKPIKGETLFRLERKPHNGEATLSPVIVQTVGRKYFTCAPEDKEWSTSSHFINTWHENTRYSSLYTLYESEQEYASEQEAANLLKQINDFFRYTRSSDIPLETLRGVRSLLYKYGGGAMTTEKITEALGTTKVVNMLIAQRDSLSESLDSHRSKLAKLIGTWKVSKVMICNAVSEITALDTADDPDADEPSESVQILFREVERFIEVTDILEKECTDLLGCPRGNHYGTLRDLRQEVERLRKGGAK